MSDPSPYPGSTAAVDPYAPPSASITPGPIEDLEDAELTRRELLKHEASVRSIGSLYILGACMMGISALAILGMTLASPEALEDAGFGIGFGLFYGLLAGLSFYLGLGLRRLEPKVRTGVTIMSGLGLLGFPLGTLINGYILYLIHCEKGKRVMSAEYQAIIAQTPHIKYRTALWLIILVALIAVFVIIGLVAAFAS